MMNLTGKRDDYNIGYLILPLFADTTKLPTGNTTTKPKLESYHIEDKGKRSCSLGSTIMDTAECRDACTELDINPVANLKKGRPCYKAGNGKCRQDGRHGSGAHLVCTGGNTSGK